MYDYDEPLYLISVVAKILGVHPQTLRQYEVESVIRKRIVRRNRVRL
ncbi:MerR family transcriptional regulator [Helicobacter pylori]